MSNADDLRKYAKSIEKDDPHGAKLLRDVADIVVD